MSAATTKQFASLDADITEALRSGDALRTLVLRTLRSELHNAKIAAGADLSEDQMLSVAKRELKKREEAAKAYEGAGSPERMKNELAESEILREYLPAATSEAQVRSHVEALKASGTLPSGPAAIGGAMRSLKETFGSSLDGAMAAQIIREVLG